MFIFLMRYHNKINPVRSKLMLKDEVEKIINEIRPHLVADGGDIELVDVDKEGTVKVKLKGACAGCPMSQMTLQLGVERYLKSKVPQVKKVISV
jgi:Fe-S cluster biogenesis protein NfuA